ncbi:biotin transporter BioY [Microbacterium hominis]|uniref:biotin transporter BioY n=1 Tax=Microbacterium TaxID=33882 RepID=UPI00168B2841|nr:MULTISPECIES: biotin transporter BioY [Microbacterium]QOC27508.1 biotin transporter BioY [Microbacterium hominis]QOC30347.1 biotin transporter BioY [Microbacterium hominis]QYF99236.1 biotin transporter BioY [Microbacterium sp. PAMC21962]
MSLAAAGRRPVLADLIARPTDRARAVALDAALVLAGAAFVAILAQVEVPLWPVPITGQTLAVVVVGAALGARRGAAALATYLVAGLAGLPVFAGFTGTIAAVAKPSFGFIIGFVFAAYVAGWFAERAWDRKPVLAFVGFVAASIVPFLFGVPYMAFILNTVLGMDLGVQEILAAGVTPFIVGGIVKAALAALLIPAAWAGVRAIERNARR